MNFNIYLIYLPLNIRHDFCFQFLWIKKKIQLKINENMQLIFTKNVTFLIYRCQLKQKKTIFAFIL